MRGVLLVRVPMMLSAVGLNLFKRMVMPLAEIQQSGRKRQTE